METDRLASVLVEIEKIKWQQMLLVSNAEDERDTRSRMNKDMLDKIEGVERDLKDIVYGPDRKSGVIIDLDRLKTEAAERKANRQHIIALWIGFGLMIIKEVVSYIIAK